MLPSLRMSTARVRSSLPPLLGGGGTRRPGFADFAGLTGLSTFAMRVASSSNEPVNTGSRDLGCRVQELRRVFGRLERLLALRRLEQTFVDTAKARRLVEQVRLLRRGAALRHRAHGGDELLVVHRARRLVERIGQWWTATHWIAARRRRRCRRRFRAGHRRRWRCRRRLGARQLRATGLALLVARLGETHTSAGFAGRLGAATARAAERPRRRSRSRSHSATAVPHRCGLVILRRRCGRLCRGACAGCAYARRRSAHRDGRDRCDPASACATASRLGERHRAVELLALLRAALRLHRRLLRHRRHLRVRARREDARRRAEPLLRARALPWPIGIGSETALFGSTPVEPPRI